MSAGFLEAERSFRRIRGYAQTLIDGLRPYAQEGGIILMTTGSNSKLSSGQRPFVVHPRFCG